MAVILVGFRAGIIDENILNGTIILILVTCLVASFATERAAKQIVISEETSDKKTEEDLTFPESILIPVANFDHLEGLMEFAHFIRDKKGDHPVRVLSVVDEVG